MKGRTEDWRFVCALAALALTVGATFAAGGVNARESKNPPSNSVARLTRMLLGTYRGSSPENDLTIVSRRIHTSLTSQLEELDVRVTGTYEKDAVFLRGLWRISPQGDDVSLVFIPGTDPLDSARRFSGPAFSPTELDAGCWTLLASRNGAFEGRIRPFPNCRNAVQAGALQSVGKEWSVQLGADGLRFENAQSGETLSFARAGE
jgi:hypothetical protein